MKTRHHIKPRSKGGKSHRDNIILVDKKKHQAYHTLFRNALPEKAVMILIKDWFYKDKNQKLKALKELIFELSKIFFYLLEEK